jgi:hypothetical protein
LDYAGELARVLAPRHLEEVLETVKSAAQKAADETGFEILEIPGVIRAAFARKSNKEALDRWAKDHGLDSCEFRGPSTNVPEIDRIAFKLQTELKQVPTDRTNVVVIYSHLFTAPPTDIRIFEQFVHALEDLAYKHSHVGYLLLIFNWIGGNENEVLHCRDHFCVNRKLFYFVCDSTILIRNRFAAKPMPPAVEERFRTAFIDAGSK